MADNGVQLDMSKAIPLGNGSGLDMSKAVPLAGTAPTTVQPTATIGAEPKPQGVQENISKWLGDLSSDVRYGHGRTVVGRILQGMGAKGTDVGAQANMTPALKPSSPLTGTITAAKGAASGDVGQTLSGLGEAATLPSMVMGGPVAKAGAEAIPSAKYAGKIFEGIEATHGGLPVNPTLPGGTALEAQRIGRLTKATVPGPIRGFLERVSASQETPLTLEEARKIYSAAVSKLSPDEAMKIKPGMRRQLAIFANKLGQAITETLAPTGQADAYMKALQEYHRAKWMEDLASTAAKWGAKGAVGYGGYEAAKSIVKNTR